LTVEGALGSASRQGDVAARVGGVWFECQPQRHQRLSDVSVKNTKRVRLGIQIKKLPYD